ncbi:hypothetical protein BCR32DRAFT_287663 [Anaeromyces robustus]|uniref:Uncharacterized protein n=1 Tax=Anaeromyces robustus TaxID=1754192 RepID=A0A1Y1VQX0_9FUNG|nr:hypothetical protein BCR32DRAFT_287663 [Anaeromyces robustus]|eukprot:ORX63573.1 hypothetical protein BCR32DRAFT_287663 [Anaeromyces robustus]
MPKFSLRKNTGYSAKSDEEMEMNQEDSVQQLRMEASQACNSLAEGLEQLSNETSQACSNIVSGVNQGFVSKDDLHCYHQEVMKQFQSYERANNEILNSLESLKKATFYFKHELKQKEKLYPTAIPWLLLVNNQFRFDVDHDVIMRTAFPYTVAQVPEPGLFCGDISEIELFCQLCGDTFKTYPCKLWPEEAKINFVQSRLRGAARSWYQTKYPVGTVPSSLWILLEELKRAFPDVVNRKLKKINLANIKHTYKLINKSTNFKIFY